MVGLVMVSLVVAGLQASSGVKELGEAAGGGLVAGIIDRVKKVFGADARLVDAVERTQAGEAVTQQVHAGRDTYVAGRDQTITNYWHPGE